MKKSFLFAVIAVIAIFSGCGSSSSKSGGNDDPLVDNGIVLDVNFSSIIVQSETFYVDLSVHDDDGLVSSTANISSDKGFSDTIVFYHENNLSSKVIFSFESLPLGNYTLQIESEGIVSGNDQNKSYIKNSYVFSVVESVDSYVTITDLNVTYNSVSFYVKANGFSSVENVTAFLNDYSVDCFESNFDSKGFNLCVLEDLSELTYYKFNIKITGEDLFTVPSDVSSYIDFTTGCTEGSYNAGGVCLPDDF